MAELSIGGQTFPLASKPPAGLILKIVEAEASNNVDQVLLLTMRMLRRLVAEEARDRFEEFIASEAFDDLDFEDIQSALEGMTAGAASRPTERSQHLPGGFRTTKATSTVVPFSPGTNQEPSTAGTSQAS